MTEQATLREQLAALQRESSARGRQRIEARGREMGVLDGRLERFHMLSTKWVQEEVLPQFGTLAEFLPPGSPPLLGSHSPAVSLERRPTDEFPVSAAVTARFSHDAEVEHIHLTFQARIIPILMNYEGEAAIEVKLDEAETPRIVEFLNERICRFASDYLRTREPDSPYQKDQVVVDPICGMTLLRREAAATAQRDGKTYFFCAEECLRRFEAGPGSDPGE